MGWGIGFSPEEKESCAKKLLECALEQEQVDKLIPMIEDMADWNNFDEAEATERVILGLGLKPTK